MKKAIQLYYPSVKLLMNGFKINLAPVHRDWGLFLARRSAKIFKTLCQNFRKIA